MRSTKTKTKSGGRNRKRRHSNMKKKTVVLSTAERSGYFDCVCVLREYIAELETKNQTEYKVGDTILGQTAPAENVLEALEDLFINNNRLNEVREALYILEHLAKTADVYGGSIQ
jgi:hypothetical protein